MSLRLIICDIRCMRIICEYLRIKVDYDLDLATGSIFFTIILTSIIYHRLKKIYGTNMS